MKGEERLDLDTTLSPYKRCLLSVLKGGYAISDRLNEQLKPFGLSEQQLNVLHILKRQIQEGCNLFDIQEQMLHKMSNATRLVEKLRLKGLVTRDICEDNRRRVEIRITDKGLALMDIIEKKLGEFHRLHENKLTEKEFCQLTELLDRLGS